MERNHDKEAPSADSYGDREFIVEEADGSSVSVFADRMEVVGGSLILWGALRSASSQPEIVAVWSPASWHSAGPANGEGRFCAVQWAAAPALTAQ